MEYPKIETLYARNLMTGKVIPDDLRLKEFALVGAEWLVTEKIDGTNVRLEVLLDGGVNYLGRTDAAQMPTFLLNFLQQKFPPSLLAAAFDTDTHAIIFGEGYGPKIQKGGVYRKDVSFRVFDVVVFGVDERPWWLNWYDVVSVAGKIGAETVPVLARSETLESAAGLVYCPSITASQGGGQAGADQEGVVCRTDPLLFTRAGQRVMWKLKVRDFA